jgi:hypothetical protein
MQEAKSLPFAPEASYSLSGGGDLQYRPLAAITPSHDYRAVRDSSERALIAHFTVG